MKTQPTTTWRESLPCRFLFLLVLATFSPATLVCAQTPASNGREKESLSALMATVKEQQEQIRRQQNEIDSLKKIGTLSTPTDNTNEPGAIVGSGTPVKHIISVTQSLVFSSPNSSSIELSVPGAQPTDLVMIGVPSDTPQSYILRGAVTKADKVLIQIHTALGAPNYPAKPYLCRIVVIGF